MQRLTEKEAYEIALKLVERYGNEENLVRNTRDRANKKTSTEALKMVLETHAAGQTIVPRVLLACAEEYVRRFPKLNASNV